jgi:hypothetical protein
MPAIINDYVITTDLQRFMVKHGPTQTLGNPDLIALTYQKADEFYRCENFTLEKVTSTDSAYHLRYNILVENKLFGYLLTDRTKKYGYNQHLRPVHVANEALYTLDFAQLLPKFLALFGLEVANHSQLDIAIDTQQADPAKLISYYTERPSKFQRIKRKNDAGITMHGSKDEATGKLEYTTYINQGSTTVTVKIYDKTKELARRPDKAYILDWYTANGFDMSKPVYRLELSIKAKALKEYTRFAVTEDGEIVSTYRANNNASSKATRQTEITTYCIDIERLNNKAYLGSLFQHFFPVDIRKKDATRPTNCTRIPLLDFSIYGEDAINTTVKISTPTNKLTMEKKMLKQHVLDYLDTGEDVYLQVAYATAARHQLTETLAQLIAKLQPLAPEYAPRKAA